MWANSELEKFGSIVKNQIFANSDDFATMGKCLEVAKVHCTLVSFFWKIP